MIEIKVSEKYPSLTDNRNNYSEAAIFSKTTIQKNTRLDMLLGYIAEDPDGVMDGHYSIMIINKSPHVMVGPISFINHSCNPNVEFHVTGTTPHVIAIRWALKIPKLDILKKHISITNMFYSILFFLVIPPGTSRKTRKLPSITPTNTSLRSVCVTCAAKYIKLFEIRKLSTFSYDHCFFSSSFWSPHQVRRVLFLSFGTALGKFFQNWWPWRVNSFRPWKWSTSMKMINIAWIALEIWSMSTMHVLEKSHQK